MTIIGFIRHGVTNWNQEGRAQGQTDIPLNEAGKAQAQAIADRLSNEDWDIIAVSDLSRAKETAEFIADGMGVSIQIVDHRLREMNCGEIEGTTEEERMQRWGPDWRELDLGIEKHEEISSRGLHFVEEIAEKYQHQKILIVSHGALIGRTLTKLIPQMNTNNHLDNTSMTIIRREEKNWQCDLYNCTAHLKNS